MNFPSNLKYTKDHEWVCSTSGTVKVGITAFAIEQLGDIVHVDLPRVGETFGHGDSFGTVESTKTVSDLYLPLAGKIVAINEDIVNAPESLQTNCYEDGWLVKVEVTSQDGVSELMDAKAYESFVKE